MPVAAGMFGMSGDRWRRFYRERDYDCCIYREGEAMIDYLETFFERVGVPATLLSVGCGPAVLELAIAERYPEMSVTCVDVAEKVVEDGREHADERGLDNVTVAVGELPELDLGRTFDLVYCMATTYFVRDVEAALRTLYAHVAPGGHLVADYPSERIREWVADQDDHTRSFFDLVASGENVRTAADVEALFETVEDYGAAVGAGDALAEAFYVPKPVT